MAGDGAAFTTPMLNLDDYIWSGSPPTWSRRAALPASGAAVRRTSTRFRYDWFNDPEIQAAFRGGIRLSAGRSDQLVGPTRISRPSFTGREIDGETGLWPQWTMAGATPSLGWLLHRCLAVDGRGASDLGLPNGVAGSNEWGIRVNENFTAGRLLHGEGRCDPTARRQVLFDREIRRMAEQLRPAGSGRGMNFSESRPGACPGATSPSRLFWYTAFTAEHGRGRPAGRERGRHAQVAHWPPRRTAPTGRTA